MLALALNPFLSLAVCAQGISTGTSGPGTTGSAMTNRLETINLLSQAPPQSAPPTTILPTDVVPLPAAQERMSFGENLQLRVLQRLPARFYFNSSVESSFRYETNVFQFPTKRKFLSQIFQLTPPLIFARLPIPLQQQIRDQNLRLASRDDMVFRVLPNVTAGWTFTPRTRFFGNFFMIRDSLFHNVRLNTVIYSIAYGIQQDIPVTRKGNLQLEFQARELYQLHQQPLFDFLPAATFSYILTPRTVLFANALLQLRGKRYFQAPTREIDPFYTFGFLHQRGGWAFSNTGTFVQNFREPFRHNASIPVNNYSWILDFEIARRLLKQLPGLQAFVRAEPIYNFHSHNRPGLAGFDFRLFWGLRFSLGKPALTAALEQIRQQLQEQEAPPPAGPPGKPTEPKPSAFLMPYQLIAGSPQPIHGPMSPSLAEFGGTKPTVAVMPAVYPEADQPLAETAVYSGPIVEESPSLEPSIVEAVPEASQPALISEPPAVVTPVSVAAAPVVSAPQKSVSPAVAIEPNTVAAATVEQTPALAPSIVAETVSAPLHSTLPPPKAASRVSREPRTELTPHAAHNFPATEFASRERSAPPVISMLPGSNNANPADEVKVDSSAAPGEIAPAVSEPESISPGSTTSRGRQTPLQNAADEIRPALDSENPAAEGSLRGPIAADNSSARTKAAKKKRERSKKIARSASPSAKPANPAGHVQMVLIPPLPPVNMSSKEKPFGDSGIEQHRPIMINIVH